MPSFIISIALFAINKNVILVFCIDLSISVNIKVMMNDRLRFNERLYKTVIFLSSWKAHLRSQIGF